MKDTVIRVFPAFRSRNFRLYFLGQSISLIGTWLQVVAEGWLVLTFTKSPFIIGFIAALATLPTLFFSLFGGVIVDHFSKRKILLFTQSASMILALIYGAMTVLKIINLTEIGILAFLLGVVNALDLPGRQAFTNEMVEKKDLSSAIAVNAGTFNGARVVGPSIAGILIGILGTGGAFIVNGLSYIAAIIALLSIKVEEPAPKAFDNPIKSIKEGLDYSFSNPKIRSLLLFTSVVAIFGWSYTTLLPLIAQTTFHADATGLGYIFAAVGVGAVCAMVILSYYGKKIDHLKFIIFGNTLFTISLFAFTFVDKIIPAYILLFLSGFGLLLTFPTINTTLQHMVEDKIRGRVLSIYVVMFVGFFPIGNFEIGAVSEHFGPQNAIRIGMVVVFIAGLILYLARNKVEAQHKEYIEAASFNEGQVNL
ncbi:MAG TPA: MFS transporter [Patescibacteria group bacterium]|nr:MFS transporter [Patescibacteria group bacterium]